MSTNDQKTKYEYNIIIYDLLGNKKDGFEVNEAKSTSDYIYISEEMSEDEIVRELKDMNYLPKKTRYSSISFTGEEKYSLYLEYNITGQPLYELRCTGKSTPIEDKNITEDNNSTNLKEKITPNEDKSDEFIENLIHEIDSISDHVQERELSEDSGSADFCASFYWGDIDPDEIYNKIESLLRESESFEITEKLIDFLKNHKDLFSFLDSHCTLHQRSNYHVPDESICYRSIGEQEEELSEEIVEKLESLNENQLKHVERYIECFIKDSYLYVNLDGEGFSYEIDIESMIESLAFIEK